MTADPNDPRPLYAFLTLAAVVFILHVTLNYPA